MNCAPYAAFRQIFNRRWVIEVLHLGGQLHARRADDVFPAAQRGKKPSPTVLEPLLRVRHGNCPPTSLYFLQQFHRAIKQLRADESTPLSRVLKLPHLT
jgi:hypothetical protein